MRMHSSSLCSVQTDKPTHVCRVFSAEENAYRKSIVESFIWPYHSHTSMEILSHSAIHQIFLFIVSLQEKTPLLTREKPQNAMRLHRIHRTHLNWRTRSNRMQIPANRCPPLFIVGKTKTKNLKHFRV